MWCKQHSCRQPAERACEDCQRGLCETCSAGFRPVLCEDCALQRNQVERARAIRELIYLGIAFVLGGIFVTDQKHDVRIVQYQTYYFCYMGYIFASIVAGWRFLFSRSEGTKVVLGGPALIVHYGFKAFLSVMLGSILVPYLVFKDIRCIVRAYQMAQSIPASGG